MKKLLLLVISLGFICNTLSAASFNSNVATGFYNSAATWLLTSGTDADGIPDADDDVTILAGHNITINNTISSRDVTVLGTLTGANTMVFTIKGNYIITGSEAGIGAMIFAAGISGGLTISGAGTFSAGVRYTFGNNSNRTISAGTTMTKSLIGIASTTLTNLGTVTLTTVNTYSGANWINGANSTLTIKATGFMIGAGRTFNATASGNTVRLQYNAGTVPIATGYYNLLLTGTAASTKTLSANTTVSNNLTVNATNNLNSNNFDLTVGGNWTNAATFTASAGKTVTLDGTAAQAMSNTIGTTTFTNLTINNTSTGVTLSSGSYIISEVLTISNGTFNTGGRPFTMTSTATQTARIAPISGTGAIAGNFTIQRCISARDTSWADFSSPVQNSTFIDWDNELPAISYYAGGPTQYTWDEAANDYSPVISSGTALTPGLGFEIFLAADYNFGSFPITTINTFGVPNQGDQDLSGMVSFNGAGSNFVGNPFASSIAWSSVLAASSGLFDYFEMYDYTIGDYNGFNSGSGVEIGATQGFWVYADGGPLTLNVPESAKTTSSNSDIKSYTKQLPYFTLKMAGANKFSHTLKVTASSEASDGWDVKDIPFRRSPNKATPVFASVADGKKQTINAFNSSNETYSMPVVTEVSNSGIYTIEAAGFDYVSEYSSITLEDRLLNKIVDLKDENVYSFKMNSTDKNDRFVVHFSKEANYRSTVSTQPVSSEFADQVEITPTTEGNQVNFNLAEVTNSRISVTNVIGQDLIEPVSVSAQSQSVNISLPSDYSGLYLIKIESSKGIVTKKYIRK